MLGTARSGPHVLNVTHGTCLEEIVFIERTQIESSLESIQEEERLLRGSNFIFQLHVLHRKGFLRISVFWLEHLRKIFEKLLLEQILNIEHFALVVMCKKY